jgi:hypothetical protein
MTSEFFQCLNSARNFLIEASADLPVHWFGHPDRPTYREHLSFSLGNQLFFIYIDPDISEITGPSPVEETLRVAAQAEGIPCRMRMTQTDNGWEPVNEDWGLENIVTGQPVHPPTLVTEGLTEINDWEVYDLSVEFVCRKIEEDGGTILSSDHNYDVGPSIWFNDKDDCLCFVFVEARRFPPSLSDPPESLGEEYEHLWNHADSGFYAIVVIAGRDQDFEVGFMKRPIAPMYRGDGYRMMWDNLHPLAPANKH